MLEEIQKPLGDFIINNIEGVQGADGVYYHYSEVCKLLRLHKIKILNGEIVKLREGCPKCGCIEYYKGDHFVRCKYCDRNYQAT